MTTIFGFIYNSSNCDSRLTRHLANVLCLDGIVNFLSFNCNLIHSSKRMSFQAFLEFLQIVIVSCIFTYALLQNCVLAEYDSLSRKLPNIIKYLSWDCSIGFLISYNALNTYSVYGNLDCRRFSITYLLMKTATPYLSIHCHTLLLIIWFLKCEQ